MAETLITDIGTVPSSVDSILTVAGAVQEEVLSIAFTNNNTTTENLKVHVVPNSSGSEGTPADTNLVCPKALAAGELFIFNIGAPIMLSETGDSIQVATDTASKVVYVLTRIHHA